MRLIFIDWSKAEDGLEPDHERVRDVSVSVRADDVLDVRLDAQVFVKLDDVAGFEYGLVGRRRGAGVERGVRVGVAEVADEEAGQPLVLVAAGKDPLPDRSSHPHERVTRDVGLRRIHDATPQGKIVVGIFLRPPDHLLAEGVKPVGVGDLAARELVERVVGIVAPELVDARQAGVFDDLLVLRLAGLRRPERWLPSGLEHHQRPIAGPDREVRPVVGIDAKARGRLKNPGREIAFLRRLVFDHRGVCRGDPRMERGIAEQVVRVPVDAAVHLEAERGQRGEHLPGGHAADPEVEFVVKKLLREEEVIKNPGILDIGFGDDEIVADVLREVVPGALGERRGDRGPIPADDLFQIEMPADDDLVRIPDRLGEPAGRISKKDAVIVKIQLHPGFFRQPGLPLREHVERHVEVFGNLGGNLVEEPAVLRPRPVFQLIVRRSGLVAQTDSRGRQHRKRQTAEDLPPRG